MSVSDFQVIEKASWATNVFIEWPSKKDSNVAAQARAAFLAIGNTLGNDRKQAKADFDRHHKRIFHQHIISVPRYLLEGRLEKFDDSLPDLDLYLVPLDEAKALYDELTGFNRKLEPPTPVHQTLSF
jgi:hypothetical protein